MKKTLIALALAVLPVAASADVVLYGQVKGGLEFTKVKGQTNTMTNVNDWGSRVGFKGEEDLGNGLKTIWQLEQKVSLDHMGSRWTAARDSFIGLATPVGTVRAGYLSDQFNSDMDTLDPWEGNGVRTLGGTFGRTSARYTGVRYDTPEFAGFQANVLYSPEDNSRADQARNAAPGVVKGLLETGNDGMSEVVGVINPLTKNNSVVAVGLNYQNSGFYAKYGFKLIHNNAGPKDGQVHRLEGGYDANNLFAGLGLQYTKNYGGAKSTKEVAATVAYTFGNVTPRLTYAHGFKNFRYDQVIGGVDYALSKRTTALASVGWLRGKSSAQRAYSAGLGLRHKF